MWATISAGNPWVAPVKNRRKDGDHYWVMANAIPLTDNGIVVGYMSVRTEASREQIQRAERLYAQMRKEKQEGRRVTTLNAGFVEKNTFFGKVQARVRQARLSTKLLAASFVNIGLGSIVGAWAATSGQTLLGVGLIAGIITFAWQLKTRIVAQPLHLLICSANNIAGGDLTQAVTRNRYDEIGDLQAALGQVSINLQSIVRDAREQSLRVVAGASEIASGNMNLSSRTEAQASNLEETAASMEEITGTIRHSAESAAQAGGLAQEVLAASERSNVAVQEVNDAMKGIHQASARISDITSVIDGIAFQTNLLALNAAVEAARAGDAGRGFAVVASEVRSLAQRSAEAAKEIKGLINESASQINLGMQRTVHASAAMSEAVVGVRKVNDFVGEISHGAREQLMGISQVNQAVSEMDGITQQNAALVEQVTASAQELEAMARASQETMQVFRITGGSNPHPARQIKESATFAKGSVTGAAPKGAAYGGRQPHRSGALGRLSAQRSATGDDDFVEF